MSVVQPNPMRLIRRQAIVIGLAVGTYGVSFGAISVASGLSVAQTSVLSLAMFTGASQFALVGVLGAGGSVVAAVLTSVLLGLRNSAYGLRLNELLQLPTTQRPIAAQLTIDESAAMALAHEHQGQAASRVAFWWTGAAVFLFWNFATLVGALGAEAISDLDAWGLDGAVPAGFLALLWPQIRSRPAALAAVLGGVVALVATPWLPPGVPVLLAGLGAIGLAVVVANRLGGDS